ncbi:MAG: hypothetical protein JWP72_2783 [Massilia sp.]|nr:hypothetical protein [Massilia sp.]MDB5790840.1 hypothetical protein [Massilia sp.]
MKIGLATEDDTVIAQPGFAEHIGAAATAVKSFLGRYTQPRKSEAWRSGYNAFYDGVHANPHSPGTEVHKEWELGSKAFEQDFEW